tara:strand:- start:237 stop:491 length:255 start_codon:yes stop_codon:yes gene_type:complete
MALCLAKVKFGLAFLLCSYIAETCLPPHIYEIEFDSEYDCLVVGYEESLNKIIEIGEEDINTHRMYIKFGCYELVLGNPGELKL